MVIEYIPFISVFFVSIPKNLTPTEDKNMDLACAVVHFPQKFSLDPNFRDLLTSRDLIIGPISIKVISHGRVF